MKVAFSNLCANCGSKPDTTDHDSKYGYLVPIYSIERKGLMYVCYGCFTALLDTDIYRQTRKLLHPESE